MNRLILSLTIIAVATLSGCAKRFSSTWVEYEQTQCSDPWHGDVEDGTDINTAVQSYLESNDVRVFEVEISGNGDAQTCMSCSCRTGNIVNAQIHEDDVHQAVTLGFLRRE